MFPTFEKKKSLLLEGTRLCPFDFLLREFSKTMIGRKILIGKHRHNRGKTRPIVNLIILIHTKNSYLAENSMFLTKTIHRIVKQM
jgi:hypothetical protein